MALSLIPTFTPSGYAVIAAFSSYAAAYALPAGTSPATILLQNLGGVPANVLLQAAAVVSPTGTAAANSTQLTVSAATSIAVGQLVQGAGIAPGSMVLAISGLVVTLSLATTAPLAGTTVNFVAAGVSPSNGIAVMPGVPLALAYPGAGAFITVQSTVTGAVNQSQGALINVAVGV